MTSQVGRDLKIHQSRLRLRSVWEYAALTLVAESGGVLGIPDTWASTKGDVRDKNLFDALDQMGRYNWEMCGLEQNMQGTVLYYFKRPVG